MKNVLKQKGFKTLKQLNSEINRSTVSNISLINNLDIFVK
jgi:hypothetical protein